MPRRKGRGRAILAAGARTLGRGLFRAVRRSDKAAHWARVGEDWFETLGELKGAAMKLGQIASQYSDLLPPEIAAQLARLQESAQPHPWDEMRGLLDWHWTDEQRALVESVEPEPLASASIGQVHRGRLADGREVAIKIQYEGVAAAVDADVRNLGRMLKLAGVLPIDGDSLDALLVEVRERMREEVDYALERRHIEQFRALPDIEGIVYPTPVPALCTQRVLVMEYAAGRPLATAGELPQATRDRIGEQFVDWIVAQIFDHGLLHADPHPGNFRVADDGTLTVLDFGCVKRIRPNEQRLMAQIVAAALARDWPRIHALLGEIGSLSRPDREMTEAMQRVYAAHARVFLEHLLAEPHFDFKDPALIPEARAVIREALPQWRAFKPVPELAFVARSLSGGYWMLRSLSARVDLKSRFEAIAARAETPDAP